MKKQKLLNYDDPFYGRVSKGKKKYELSYKYNSWDSVSLSVRLRDKKCLRCHKKMEKCSLDNRGICKKCGHENLPVCPFNFDADHFHPKSYTWMSLFFRLSKIQTLCKSCHRKMPSRENRMENWKKFCFLK